MSIPTAFRIGASCAKDSVGQTPKQPTIKTMLQHARKVRATLIEPLYFFCILHILSEYFVARKEQGRNEISSQFADKEHCKTMAIAPILIKLN